MAYNSAHTGPEIDAAVQLLGQIQEARNSTSQDLSKVKDLASQVKVDADQVAGQTEVVTSKAAQVSQDAAAVEQARQEVVGAAATANEAMDAASLSAASALESQNAASISEQAAASSQLAAGLSEQVSAESASQAKAAADQVADDRKSAAESAASAAASAQNAEAVVTGGTASVNPGPGLIPLADAQGKIDEEWLPPSVAKTESVQSALEVADRASNTAAEAQARAASFLLPSPEAPVVRDDGAPLQIGDRYFNSVEQAEFIYTSAGWALNDSLQAITDIRDSHDPEKGATEVGFDGGSAAEVLLGAKSMQSYAALRAYTGIATGVRITQRNTGGFFEADPLDTVSADNGATVIVAGNGVRYKRSYVGAIKLEWFIDPSDKDHTAAWTQAIQLNNSGFSKGLVLEVPSYVTKVTSELPTITSPMWISGAGASRSIVFFAGPDGFIFDHSALPAGSACGRISDLSITTNIASKTGLKLIGQSTSNPGMKFRLSNVELVPHARAIGAEDSSEWAVAIQVGLPGGNKASEVILDDVVITGSLSNTIYATRTNSIGLLVYSSTGVRYNLPKISLVGNGIVFVGQCEGAIITNGTILGVNKGVVFKDLVSPANNHVVSGTHVSAYTRGISFEQPAAGAPLSMGNFISGAFILEREPGTNKSEDYVGIELYAKYSEIRDTLVWSNGFGGSHKRIGVRASYHNNKVDVSFKNCEYPFDVVPYAPDADSGCVYADSSVISGANLVQIDKSSSANLVYSNLKDPTIGSSALVQRAASFRIRHNSADKNLFRVNSGGLSLGDHLAGTVTIDVSSTTSGSTGYDSRILFTGGDSSGSVSGKGDIQLAGASVRVNAGAIRPENSGQSSLGQASFPFSAVYANTGTIQPSDERLKQDVTEIPDAVLDAWESVNYCMYRFKESVALKGDDARWHVGVIAQQVYKAFKDKGLDPFRYGILGHDSWGEQPEVVHSWDAEVNAEGVVVKEAGSQVVTAYRPAGDRYSIRYDEACNLQLALSRRNECRVKSLIEALEQKLSLLA